MSEPDTLEIPKGGGYPLYREGKITAELYNFLADPCSAILWESAQNELAALTESQRRERYRRHRAHAALRAEAKAAKAGRL